MTISTMLSIRTPAEICEEALARGISIDDLCLRAGVSLSTFYRARRTGQWVRVQTALDMQNALEALTAAGDAAGE